MLRDEELQGARPVRQVPERWHQGQRWRFQLAECWLALESAQGQEVSVDITVIPDDGSSKVAKDAAEEEDDPETKKDK